MSTNNEVALRLALEALTKNSDRVTEIRMKADAIKALEIALSEREALAQSRSDVKQEHDLQDKRCECCGYMTYQREHMGCIRSAKQEHGEPLAYLVKHFQGDEQVLKANSDVMPVFFKSPEHFTCEPLYTTPQQRKPLTDEQIKKVWGIHDDDDDPTNIVYERDITRAIEAAHGIHPSDFKEKNT